MLTYLMNYFLVAPHFWRHERRDEVHLKREMDTITANVDPNYFKVMIMQVRKINYLFESDSNILIEPIISDQKLFDVS